MSCVVCGQWPSTPAEEQDACALSTPMCNFTSVSEFLVEYGVVDSAAISSAPSSSSLVVCTPCSSLVTACDTLLSQLGHNVDDLRKKRALKDSAGPAVVKTEPVSPASVVRLSKKQVDHVVRPVGRRKKQPLSASEHAYGAPVSVNDEPVLPRRSLRSRSQAGSAAKKPRYDEGDTDDEESSFLVAIPEIKMEVIEDEEEADQWQPDAASSDDDDDDDPIRPGPSEETRDPATRAAEAVKALRRKAANAQGVIQLGDTAPCPWCKKPVRTSLDERFAHIVARHNKKNVGDRRCWDCAMPFFSAIDLQDHLDEHRKMLVNHVACIHCRKVVPVDLFPTHVEVAHPGGLARTAKERAAMGDVKPLKCLQCRFWCTEREAWNLHHLQAHCTELRCWFCNMSFPQRTPLNVHMRREHLKRPLISCSLCGKGFYCWKRFFAHFPRNHDGVNLEELDHNCPFCNVDIPTRQLREHLQKTHGEVSYKSEKFSDTFSLLRRIHDKEAQKERKAQDRLSEGGSSAGRDGDSSDDSDDEDGSGKVKIKITGIEPSPRRKQPPKRPLTAEEREKKGEYYRKHKEKGSPCPLCLKPFGHKKSIRSFMFHHYAEEHSIPDGLRCWDCGQFFATDAELDEHLANHRRDSRSKIVCIHCRRVVERGNFQEHVLRFHPSGLARTRAERAAAGVLAIRCKECTYWTTAETQFNLHMARAHETKAAWCEICDEEFPNPGRFTYHMQTHHAEDVLCPKCGDTFSPTALKRHKQICQKTIEKVQCSECGKELAKESMKHHMAAAHGIGEKRKINKMLVCPVCGYKAYGQPHYAAHMKTNHSVDLPGLKEYICKLCRDIFYHNRDFTAHLRRDHGILNLKLLETGLICNICGERAPEKAPFMEHLLGMHGLDIPGKQFMNYVVVQEEKGGDPVGFDQF